MNALAPTAAVFFLISGGILFRRLQGDGRAVFDSAHAVFVLAAVVLFCLACSWTETTLSDNGEAVVTEYRLWGFSSREHRCRWQRDIIPGSTRPFVWEIACEGRSDTQLSDDPMPWN